MVNNLLLNPAINKASELGMVSEEENSPVELFPHASSAEAEIVIRTTYRQLLGNAHIMESERLTVAESQLKGGEISVREFVRLIAKSELYKSRFIDNSPRYRSHELNFKHLLGRAPDGYEETIAHSQILDSQGYEADIDSYIDSEEYQNVFGENIVPYYRGYQTQTGKKLLGYTNMLKMLESLSTSDKAGETGNSPRLLKPLIYNNPNGNIPVTDVNELLRDLFQTKARYQATLAKFTPYLSPLESAQPDEEIAELEAKLVELQSLATIGAAGINRWRSSYVDINNANVATSSNKSSTQNKQEYITALKQQIAQASSLAALGEARLNKWRSRAFY